MSDARSVCVAVVQAAPVLFDLEATLNKVIDLTRDAAAKGAQLVVFPEAMISAYPRGLDFGVAVGSRSHEGRALYARYVASSLPVPGPGVDRLGDAARELGIYLVVGVIEREASPDSATLYCSLLYFGPDGRLLHKHRKLKPTAAERYIWGEGDGRSLKTITTPWGGMGGLICWENYMPLARAALYQQGLALYLAPTADARDTWTATMRHIACESRSFVLGCNQFVTRDMYPGDIAAQLRLDGEVLCQGGSVIASPMGEIIEGPLYGREDMLVARLEIEEIIKARFDFDPTGHYARPDIFRLEITGPEGKGK